MTDAKTTKAETLSTTKTAEPIVTEVTGPVPTAGSTVLYALSESDAVRITNQREHGTGNIGNDVQVGDVFPLLITRAWGGAPDSKVNGQVFLDGNDHIWVTSVTVGDEPGTFAWPVTA